MKNEEIKYNIDSSVVKNYVVAINSIKSPMRELKEQLNVISKPMPEQLSNIVIMINTIKDLTIKFPNEQMKIYTDTIKQIIEANKGILSTRMIEPLNINRQYISILEKKNIIEKVSRGIYHYPETFEDSYFIFQQKYKKAIFSHMNALYFYKMTEEFPYNYTVTVPYSYHVSDVNDKCNVFYVNDDIYEIGICEVETPSGNKIRAYDLERCICDIIRSKNRMDIEQIKKTIKKYVKSDNKDIAKLTEYSKRMGIKKQVMEMVGMYYD